VEYLLVPPVLVQRFANSLAYWKMKSPSVQLFLNGAQIVSKQFKENLKAVFQGTPFVSYHFHAHNLANYNKLILVLSQFIIHL